MQCPRCKFNGSRVIDSRPADDGRSIRRRRECDECGYRFTTFERLEKAPILVIKRNGNREAFNREKLLNGLVRSAEKRPIPLSQLEQIVNEVEHTINQEGENEISSMLIGEMVMDYLAKIDDIAYIRFASVYRQFTDRKMFLKELERMSFEMDRKDSKS
ncbi:transcriptional regulator NrdR [Granulicatella elegans]|jgi:transcriptional regulator nrdR|uniref:Transcriptional repressor NrdR n=1 Tax=Granulicatella elegans ATCC 700633 TaxID=626369 RepID=D0BJD6_9LACT|nr:transcriptional regulator NrdR [Granulicatella elegans]EEW93189.1 transcriptional regulator NrdR [Granulicatella elegans ATCC 700633]RKW29047.1 MAG: transcriptional regulator NrdR [Granulicatella sp.]RKW29286.1 MAG: transcriptional regulator NrdR [Granulicatella sp.]